MDHTWSLDEARDELPELIAHVDGLIALRADLVDARLAMERGEQPRIGGLPEVKAVEAQLQEAIDWFARRGIDLKGIAPVIVDFPADDGTTLLCWLEGETALDWWHPADTGFMGRRRLPE